MRLKQRTWWIELFYGKVRTAEAELETLRVTGRVRKTKRPPEQTYLGTEEIEEYV